MAYTEYAARQRFLAMHAPAENARSGQYANLTAEQRAWAVWFDTHGRQSLRLGA